MYDRLLDFPVVHEGEGPYSHAVSAGLTEAVRPSPFEAFTDAGRTVLG